jgi:alpha-L-rhamnosidase
MPQGLQAVNGGRTTLAEAWGGGASQNHCMIGHVQEWLHGYLVGIRPDPDAPGLKHFLLEPNPVGNLTWAKAHHDGPYGRISLHWQRQNGQLIVECTVPPNSTATLRLPTTDPNAVREQDKPLSQAAGISSVDSKPTHITLTLAAGTYKMTAAN